MSAETIAREAGALALAVLCGAGSAAWAQEPGASGAARVVILGTGTPNADPERSGPAVAIVVNGTPYLVDAGPGIVRRAAAAGRAGIGGLEPPRLATVFITHLHSDHTLGLPDLLLTPWTLERTAPLRVFGPPGVRALAEHVAQAYAEDVRVRLEGLEPANRTGHVIEPHEVVPGVVYRDSNVTVRAFAVPHGAWPHAYGYRFETAGRVIVVSGDTGPTDAVVEQCAGCDVLVHEVYSAERFRTRPAEWQRYHASAHTSTAELAGIAGRARPALLVLYHQLFWGATDEDLLAEVRAAGYAGRVVSARDLDAF